MAAAMTKFPVAKAIEAPFRLPVGPRSGYSTVNQGRMGRPFGKYRINRIAVRVINHLGDEMMTVFSVG